MLEQEQIDALKVLVKASRSVSREEREPFHYKQVVGERRAVVEHPGLPDQMTLILFDDLQMLERERLLAITRDDRYYGSLFVTPEGYQYYESIQRADQMTKLREQDLNWSLKRGVNTISAASELARISAQIREFIAGVASKRSAGTGSQWDAIQDFSHRIQPQTADLVSQIFLDPDVIKWLVQQDSHIPDAENYLQYLKNIADRLTSLESRLSATAAPSRPKSSDITHPERDVAATLSSNALALLSVILHRFHIFACQLQERRENRSTLTIKDEYDVQDLLHALLRFHFDDVRPEEWTPSYAGKSSRVDFWLKPQKTVVEAKKTRPSLTAKELGDQLIIDIHRYARMSDCNVLLCFIYDPDGLLKNPRGFEADLSGQRDGLLVQVIVAPRH